MIDKGGQKTCFQLAAAVSMVVRVSAKLFQQVERGLMGRNFSAQDFLVGNIGAVHGFVPAVVSLHHGAIQADPGKDAFAA
jgi:hypothetical protein